MLQPNREKETQWLGPIHGTQLKARILGIVAMFMGFLLSAVGTRAFLRTPSKFPTVFLLGIMLAVLGAFLCPDRLLKRFAAMVIFFPMAYVGATGLWKALGVPVPGGLVGRILLALIISAAVALLLPSRHRETSLHRAVRDGRLDTSRLLWVNKTDVNAKDEDGRTPLHLTVVLNRRDEAEKLLTNGAEVNAKDDKGQTPLHLAAAFDRCELAELLLANQADVTAKDNHAWTPLRWALATNHEKVAKLLRLHGGQA